MRRFSCQYLGRPALAEQSGFQDAEPRRRGLRGGSRNMASMIRHPLTRLAHSFFEEGRRLKTRLLEETRSILRNATRDPTLRLFEVNFTRKKVGAKF